MLLGDPSSHPDHKGLTGNPPSARLEAEAHKSFASRFIGWLAPGRSAPERRSRPRVDEPPLRAFLGVFGSSEPYQVRNISSTGLYLIMTDRWTPGAQMPLRIERTDQPGFAALSRFVVPTCVVRRDTNGIGFAFVHTESPKPAKTSLEVLDYGWQGARWADRHTIEEMVTEFEAAKSSGQKPH